eukprot:evm.model.scf_1854.6 EVM.evm.TU.scf_1854.6   scf_1854:19147-24044(+)
MRRLSSQGLLAFLCAALCCAAVGAGPSPAGRGLLSVAGEEDDDETFRFDLERDDFKIGVNSTAKFCFGHKVSCVKYEIRATKDTTSGTPEPARLLALVLPKRAARKAEEERVVASRSVVPGSLCQDSGFCIVSIKVDDKDDLCVLIANADIKFESSGGRENEDFRIGQQGNMVVDVDIEGCATTAQRIVAIAAPIAVFIGVAACFSTWWIRRRRKEHMAGGPPPPPPQGQPPSAYPPTGQLPPVGSSGVPRPPPPMVTPAPGAGTVVNPAYGAGMGYGPSGGYGPQGVYGPQPGYFPGGMDPAYNSGHIGIAPSYSGTGTRPVAGPDGYPIVVANV